VDSGAVAWEWVVAEQAWAAAEWVVEVVGWGWAAVGFIDRSISHFS
jgi:hypothetical protein